MLLIDRRENDRAAGRELISCLRRYDIELATDIELNCDAMFQGNGEHGECLVGIEHKRLSDLITSMKEKRLAGLQLPRMQKTHDYIYVFAEGVWRPGPGGEIEELRQGGWRTFYGKRDRYSVNYRQVSAFLNSLQMTVRAEATGEPVRVVRTQNPRETAAQYAAIYLWWTEKRWDQHHTNGQIYTEVTLPKRTGFVQKKVTVAWKMAAQIPGIDRGAEQVARHFKTPKAMALAGVKEWMEVEGIGKVRAEAAVKAFTEEE